MSVNHFLTNITLILSILSASFIFVKLILLFIVILNNEPKNFQFLLKLLYH